MYTDSNFIELIEYYQSIYDGDVPVWQRIANNADLLEWVQNKGWVDKMTYIVQADVFRLSYQMANPIPSRVGLRRTEYENIYYCPLSGGVWDDCKEKWLTQTKLNDKDAYNTVLIEGHKRYVHRLPFLDLVTGQLVLHFNDIPSDNRIVNLRPGTPVENKSDEARNKQHFQEVEEFGEEIQEVIERGLTEVLA